MNQNATLVFEKKKTIILYSNENLKKNTKSIRLFFYTFRFFVNTVHEHENR
jgi:hypothetical protein